MTQPNPFLDHALTFDPIVGPEEFPPMTPERHSILVDFGLLHNNREEIIKSLEGQAAFFNERQAARPRSDVSLYETPSNNHGCNGFGVDLVIIDKRTARVVSGSSCSSCWQVGHDNADSPIKIGTIVTLPDWCDSWNEASAPYGRSHNELVDDSEHPRPDCSFVQPSELIK